jgi:hypothetical protein
MTRHAVYFAEVAIVVTPALRYRNDVIDFIGTWLMADVTDATITPADASSCALPMLGQRLCAPHLRHRHLVAFGAIAPYQRACGSMPAAKNDKGRLGSRP